MHTSGSDSSPVRCSVQSKFVCVCFFEYKLHTTLFYPTLISPEPVRQMNFGIYVDTLCHMNTRLAQRNGTSNIKPTHSLEITECDVSNTSHNGNIDHQRERIRQETCHNLLSYQRIVSLLIMTQLIVSNLPNPKLAFTNRLNYVNIWRGIILADLFWFASFAGCT